MGDMPPWYPQAAAARYWGVPPWELDDQPALWIFRASAMASAENHAEEMAIKHGK
jgi:hypothetical protein